MSRILETAPKRNVEMSPIHLLELNLETFKFEVSAMQGYTGNDNYIIIPKLKSAIQFSKTNVNDEVLLTSTVTDGTVLNIFVLDRYSSKKSIFEEDKANRIHLYKSIISETLRLLLANLTAVYRKTHSIDIGEEINRLLPVYTAYSK